MPKIITDIITEKMSGFSKGQKRIANAILQSYEKTAYMTAAKLGEFCEVSESTVVRFAGELGYEGYPEMQKAVQELVRTKLTPNQRIEVTNLRFGDADVLSSMLTADMEKIKYTLEHTDREAFRQAVTALLGARNIYIYGARSSTTLAYFLDYNLQMISGNIRYVQPTASHEVFEQLFSLGKGDVLFAISFPRYSKKVINAVRYAREVGAEVIALTDSKMSPLAEYASYLLTAQSDMASYVDSLVAPLSICNALLVAIAKERQAEIASRFDRLEHIWDQYDVYEKH